MLVYGAKDLILIGYTNSDFQTDKDSRKSTSKLVFTMNGGVWYDVASSKDALQNPPRRLKMSVLVKQRKKQFGSESFCMI
ncbi:gag/pol protein [Cucumis melo var. makuwa]|uniref:Gag/pol protein n=1 Tax=Cucumis melo var. makuwa TaxID=1194695 RepID=A0A5A7VKI9_CUCMM|nr:gag/pol protein [Cucumis melo var. makuwa]TYK30227.1 gag/pol protein [Cucumis melo var. makuwa]